MVPLEHDVQDLHEASECDVESCHVDVAVQDGHDRSAVVVQATNLVPLPQEVAQLLQRRFTVFEQAVVSYCDEEQVRHAVTT